MGIYDNLLMSYFGVKEFSETNTKTYFFIENTSYNSTIRLQTTANGDAPDPIVEYSDDGFIWNSGTYIDLEPNKKKYIRRKVDSWYYNDGTNNGYQGFDGRVGYNDAKLKIGGNIMSLLYGDTFNGQTEFPNGSSRNFSQLFQYGGVSDISDLILPATTLTEDCYRNMFYSSEFLTSAPLNLLPATNLANGCYDGMFENTGLTSAPSLPATVMKNKCYGSMFAHTKLTTAPTLPATTLAESCYLFMFNGVTTLTTVPSNYLPATTLFERCYENMFMNSGLTETPVLPALIVPNYAYQSMFYGCSHLNKVTCMATSIIPSDTWNGSTRHWLKNVAATGTFIKNSDMSSWTNDENGIPSGWTVQNA